MEAVIISLIISATVCYLAERLRGFMRYRNDCAYAYKEDMGKVLTAVEAQQKRLSAVEKDVGLLTLARSQDLLHQQYRND